MSFFAVLVSVQWLATLLVMIDLGPFHIVALKLVNLTGVGAIAMIMKLFAVGTAISLASTVNVILKIRRRTLKMASPTSADHFILRTYLLDAFLMGSSLLLLLVISRIRDQANQLHMLKADVDSLTKQSAAMRREYMVLKTEKKAEKERETSKANEELVSLKDLVAALRNKMEKLQLECLEKDKIVKTAEANARAMQKQSEGFLLEYDRLLDDNESLRSQLISIDQRHSHSGSKKKV